MTLDRDLLSTILDLMRQKKKQVEMAQITGKHKNTIWKYVKHIRSQQVYEDHLIVNKIDNRLANEINTMPYNALLMWRGQIVPKRIESTSELTVHKEVKPLDVRQWSTDERDEITRVVRRIAAARTLGEEPS
jgi:hypothetical protein